MKFPQVIGEGSELSTTNSVVHTPRLVRKKKEKKKERPRKSACYGHRKHKSFAERKHIFSKQETDAKSLFFRMTEIRMDVS